MQLQLHNDSPSWLSLISAVEIRAGSFPFWTVFLSRYAVSRSCSPRGPHLHWLPQVRSLWAHTEVRLLGLELLPAHTTPGSCSWGQVFSVPQRRHCSAGGCSQLGSQILVSETQSVAVKALCEGTCLPQQASTSHCLLCYFSLRLQKAPPLYPTAVLLMNSLFNLPGSTPSCLWSGPRSQKISGLCESQPRAPGAGQGSIPAGWHLSQWAIAQCLRVASQSLEGWGDHLAALSSYSLLCFSFAFICLCCLELPPPLASKLLKSYNHKMRSPHQIRQLKI